jgi:hypothetical protein
MDSQEPADRGDSHCFSQFKHGLRDLVDKAIADHSGEDAIAKGLVLGLMPKNLYSPVQAGDGDVFGRQAEYLPRGIERSDS